MYIAWTVVSIVLFIIWLFVAVLSIGGCLTDGGTKREFQMVSASLALAMLFVLFHWIILLVAVPAFVIYGLFQFLRLVFSIRQKKKAAQNP